MRRLRLSCRGVDPLAASWRARASVAALDLGTAGLPPSAILCARSLPDPRPRSCRLTAQALQVPDRWRDSVRAELERLARRAARPALGAVSPSADCVVFADRAELLASLAEDWCAGVAAGRWWWRSLLGGRAADARALLAAWRQTPEHVPGALERLAEKGKAAAFAHTLPPGEARALTLRVAAAFGLDALARSISALPDTPAPRPAPVKQHRPEDDGHTSRSRVEALTPPRPPWLALAPESDDARLSAAQQSFLGVCLALRRAPSAARAAEFTRRAARWSDALARPAEPRPSSAPARAHETITTARTHAETPTGEGTGVEPPTIPTRPTDDAAKTPTGGNQNELRPRESDPVRPRASHAPKIVDARAVEPRSSADGDGSPASRARAGTGEAAERTFADDGARLHAEAEPAGQGLTRPESAATEPAQPSAAENGLTEYEASKSEAAEPDSSGAQSRADAAESESERGASPLFEAEIETRFGGLFHLVNLAQFLELYGDFTRPAEPGLALDIWDFVALVGRRLVGPRVEADPLWPLLARLAARDEEDEPGRDFEPDADWRVPHAWLKPFASARARAWRWAASEGRLRVLHPAGFFVIDVALAGYDASPRFKRADSRLQARAVLRQLARELRPYRDAGASFRLRSAARRNADDSSESEDSSDSSREFKASGDERRERWLRCVAVYVRARLKLALGAKTTAGVARLLLARRARVFVTTTHVDVVMRLSELPVEVRFAGLDRDPGWVPAAGRYVAFHFD